MATAFTTSGLGRLGKLFRCLLVWFTFSSGGRPILPGFRWLMSLRRLGDLREISHKLLFLDDQEVISICFDQSEVPKALHKDADPRPRRAHHL